MDTNQKSTASIPQRIPLVGVPSISRYLAVRNHSTLSALSNSLGAQGVTQEEAEIERRSKVDKYITSHILPKITTKYAVIGRESADKSKIALFNSCFLKTDLASPLKHDPSDSEITRLHGLHEGDHQTLIITFEWDKFDVSVYIAIHTEYIAITIVMAGIGNSVNRLTTAVDEIQFKILRGVVEPSSYMVEYKTIYEEIWKEFSDNLFDPTVDDVLYLLGNKTLAEFRRFVIRGKNQNVQDIFVAYRPLLSSHSGGGRAEEAGEFAVSSLWNSHYVHISTLEHVSGGEYSVSLIYTEKDDPEVTGRISQWLGYLGTMRFAATYEFESISKVGNELRGIFRHVELIRKRAHRSDIAEIGREIDVARERLLSIESSNEFCVSFIYRIERAKYYIDQFDFALTSLDISNIGDYITLSGLVNNKHRQQFDYINRIIRRYKYIVSSIAATDGLISSRGSATLAKETNELAGQMVFAVDDLKKTAMDVKELQQSAEIAFWAILAPYYLGSVIEHVFGFGDNESDSPLKVICELATTPKSQAASSGFWNSILSLWHYISHDLSILKNNGALTAWGVVVVATSAIALGKLKLFQRDRYDILMRRSLFLLSVVGAAFWMAYLSPWHIIKCD